MQLQNIFGLNRVIIACRFQTKFEGVIMNKAHYI